MNNKKFTLLAIAIGMAIIGVFNIYFTEQHLNHFKSLGATIPEVPSLFVSALQNNMAVADTSLTMVNGNDRLGNPLNGHICLTIDSNTPYTEYTCGTASSTTVTNLVRGIDPITGVTSESALTFTHRRGADIRVTDFPALAIVSRIMNGQESIPNLLYYDDSVASSSFVGNLQAVPSVAYVNNIGLSGGVNASTTTQGFVQFATMAQTSSGTLQGSSGAFLVPANGNFSNTSSGQAVVPVAMGNGKLSQGFLDLTQGYTWTGLQVFNAATTTFNAPVVTTASSTFTFFPRIAANATPTLATEFVPKSYVDSKLSNLATGTEAVSLSISANSVATSTGMSLVTDGNQSVVVNYSCSAAVNENQVHTELIEILIDNVSKTSFSVANPVTQPGAFPCAINYISSKLSAATHSIKLRITDSGPGSSGVAAIGVGSAFTIR